MRWIFTDHFLNYKFNAECASGRILKFVRNIWWNYDKNFLAYFLDNSI